MGTISVRRSELRVGVATVLLGLLLTLAGAASTWANTAPYAEPVYTKPVSGVNSWHWRVNGAGSQTAYCFTFSKKEGSPLAFTTYNAFTTGAPVGPAVSGSTQNPNNVPLNYCSRRDATSFGSFSKSLGSPNPVVNGEIWRYCAQEYIWYLGAWDYSAYPVQCMDTTIDSASPTINLTLANGATYATSATIARRLNYSDSVSPPWADNRICTVNSRACNGSDTFNFDSACSSGSPSTLTAIFNCSYTHGGGDGTVWQCVYGFDSASVDAQPNLSAAPALNTNPAFPAGTGNASAIGCDSIVLDRAAPSLTPSAGQATVQVGQTVNFNLAASDATSGLAGQASWNFGDGGTANGTSPSHAYATAGTRTVTVSQSDAAGNSGSATLSITVQAAPGATPTPTPKPPTPTATPNTPTPSPGPGTPAPGPGAGPGGPPPATGGAVEPAGPTTAAGVAAAAGGGGTTTASAGGLKLVAPKKPSLRKLKNRRLPLALTTPGAGKAEFKLKRGTKTLVTSSVTFTAAGTAAVSLKLPKGIAAGKTKLRVSFTPSAGGAPIVKTVTVDLKR